MLCAYQHPANAMLLAAHEPKLSPCLRWDGFSLPPSCPFQLPAYWLPGSGEPCTLALASWPDSLALIGCLTTMARSSQQSGLPPPVANTRTPNALVGRTSQSPSRSAHTTADHLDCGFLA